MKKGFTLIELLVVVLIIGILSAVAVPQYTKSVEKAKASQAMVYLDAWVKAQQMFKLNNGNYHPYWPDTVFTAAGIEKPTMPSDLWAVYTGACFGSSCNTATAPYSQQRVQRKLSNTADVYSLAAAVISRDGEGDFVMRWCTGSEKMCKTFGGGQNCSENGSPSDVAWCYSEKSSFEE